MNVLYPAGARAECEFCRFFSNTGEPEAWGDCRRSAPTMLLTQDGQTALWPQVGPHDWCGDFELALVDQAGKRLRL